MSNTDKVIILGSEGYIGSFLFKEFLKNKTITPLGYSRKDIDLTCIDSIYSKLSNINTNDTIIFTSAVTNLKGNNFDLFQKNILMAQNLCTLLKDKPIKKLIYLSTVDVYGVPPLDHIINEQSPINPSNYYAISKLASEKILKFNCLELNIKFITLRLPGVYGENDINRSAIWRLVNAAINNKKIIIYGNGQNLRDYIHIKQIYNTCQSLLYFNENLTANLITGESFSINNIAKTISEILSYKIIILYKDPKINQNSFNLSYNSKLIDRINKKFNIEKIKLKDGLTSYIKSFLNNLNVVKHS